MKFVVLGDSIAAGLGVKDRSYCDLLLEKLKDSYRNAQALNLAGSAMQINESRACLSKVIDHQPDVVVIAHGITEAIIRPRQKSLRFVPKRWRRAGWMDPRPYYSRRPWRRFIQRLESSIRWRVKNILIRNFGGLTWMSQTDYENHLKEVVTQLIHHMNAKIILMSHCGIDEKFFPNSLTSLDRFNSITERVSRIYENQVFYCELRYVCEKWDDFFQDHFHPNEKGHRKIANKIYEIMVRNVRMKNVQ